MRKTAQKVREKNCADCAKAERKISEKKAVSDALLIEGDTEEISFCPDEFGISDQQAKFAMLVAQGKSRQRHTDWLVMRGKVRQLTATPAVCLEMPGFIVLSATSAISTRNAIPQTWIYW